MRKNIKNTLVGLMIVASSFSCSRDSEPKPARILSSDAVLTQKICNENTPFKTVIYAYSFPYGSEKGVGSYGLINGSFQYYVGDTKISPTKWIPIDSQLGNNLWLVQLKKEFIELKNNGSFSTEREYYGLDD